MAKDAIHYFERMASSSVCSESQFVANNPCTASMQQHKRKKVLFIFTAMVLVAHGTFHIALLQCVDFQPYYKAASINNEDLQSYAKQNGMPIEKATSMGLQRRRVVLPDAV